MSTPLPPQSITIEATTYTPHATLWGGVRYEITKGPPPKGLEARHAYSLNEIAYKTLQAAQTTHEVDQLAALITTLQQSSNNLRKQESLLYKIARFVGRFWFDSGFQCYYDRAQAIETRKKELSTAREAVPIPKNKGGIRPLPPMTVAYNLAIQTISQMVIPSERSAQDVQPFLDAIDAFIKTKRKVLGTLPNHELITPSEYSALLQAIPSAFFDDKDQARARERCRLVLAYFGYPLFLVSSKKPSEQILKELIEQAPPLRSANPLNQMIVRKGYLGDVADVIKQVANQENELHLFQVASQYNFSESADASHTPPVGGAMQRSDSDSTQGPAAQRMNFLIFETLNAFLANGGACMLPTHVKNAEGALIPTPWGATYHPEDPVANGCLRPNKEILEACNACFIAHMEQITSVCYASYGKDYSHQKSPYLAAGTSWGNAQHPVFLMPQSAPAVSASDIDLTLLYSPEELAQWPLDTDKRKPYPPLDQLERNFAFNNYRMLFDQAIQLQKDPTYKKEQAYIHVTPVGTGAFGNKVENIIIGLKMALHDHAEALEANHIQVLLDGFDESAPFIKLANNAHLADYT